jgi:hypothetical protein
VQVGNRNGRLACGLEECIRRHEEEHIRDLLATAYRNNVCRGKPRGEVVTFNSPCELYQSEVRATRVEIACISAKLDENSCPDACRQTLISRLTQLEGYLEGFIRMRNRHCGGSR